MGGMTGKLSKRIEYYGPEEHTSAKKTGVYVTDLWGHTTRSEEMDILDYLERQQKFELFYDRNETCMLPFVGGHLGYLGYEVRYDTMRKLDPQAPRDSDLGIPTKRTDSRIPTAAFLFCDQALVHDNVLDEWHLIHVTNDEPNGATSDWMDATESVLRQLPPPIPEPSVRTTTTTTIPPLAFIPNRPKASYQADIDNCHEQIRRGESYELCLTNQLETTARGTPWNLYKILRKRNPAPYSGFFHFGGTGPRDAKVSICCSSPERFVSVQPRNGSKLFLVEAKPIKGTAARPMDPSEDEAVARQLSESIKNRAENLMIVDLLRNDMHRVCQNVHVPKLMAIESYATVHQLVSTIRGELGVGKNAVDVLTACFPGGSMTGAPKRRTMELLHAMEQQVSRGPYSGSLGYMSLNGRMDMNIIIRSAVLTPTAGDEEFHVSIGAGGAITALSESDDEYEEMLLKARAVKEAVEQWAGTSTTITNGESHRAEKVKVQSSEELRETRY